MLAVPCPLRFQSHEVPIRVCYLSMLETLDSAAFGVQIRNEQRRFSTSAHAPCIETRPHRPPATYLSILGRVEVLRGIAERWIKHVERETPSAPQVPCGTAVAVRGTCCCDGCCYRCRCSSCFNHGLFQINFGALTNSAIEVTPPRTGEVKGFRRAAEQKQNRAAESEMKLNNSKFRISTANQTCSVGTLRSRVPSGRQWGLHRFTHKNGPALKRPCIMQAERTRAASPLGARN